jgi:hypothetical protein
MKLGAATSCNIAPQSCYGVGMTLLSSLLTKGDQLDNRARTKGATPW